MLGPQEVIQVVDHGLLSKERRRNLDILMAKIKLAKELNATSHHDIYQSNDNIAPLSPLSFFSPLSPVKGLKEGDIEG